MTAGATGTLRMEISGDATAATGAADFLKSSPLSVTFECPSATSSTTSRSASTSFCKRLKSVSFCRSISCRCVILIHLSPTYWVRAKESTTPRHIDADFELLLSRCQLLFAVFLKNESAITLVGRFLLRGTVQFVRP